MQVSVHRYFALNKPFNMVSQFISNHPVRLLGAIDFNFPEGTHAIGRLDNQSEGLLILTTNKKVTDLLFNSKTPHTRTYVVLVKGKVSQSTLDELRNGVDFLAAGNKNYRTKPCEVKIIEHPDFKFKSPYTQNSYLDYTWLEIVLTEGKYHQVRKMVATVGHKCVRLVRTSIEGLSLGDLLDGAVEEIYETSFCDLIKIKL